jgi:hypothetical protein
VIGHWRCIRFVAVGLEARDLTFQAALALAQVGDALLRHFELRLEHSQALITQPLDVRDTEVGIDQHLVPLLPRRALFQQPLLADFAIDAHCSRLFTFDDSQDTATLAQHLDIPSEARRRHAVTIEEGALGVLASIERLTARLGLRQTCQEHERQKQWDAHAVHGGDR